MKQEKPAELEKMKIQFPVSCNIVYRFNRDVLSFSRLFIFTYNVSLDVHWSCLVRIPVIEPLYCVVQDITDCTNLERVFYSRVQMSNPRSAHESGFKYEVYSNGEQAVMATCSGRVKRHSVAADILAECQ